MAYNGTTAASSVSNPPIRLAGAIGRGANAPSSAGPIGAGLWFYGTTDTSSAPFGSGYFSDGYQLGMRQGDVMIVSAIQSTVSSSQTMYIGIVSSVSTGGAAQLSTQSMISSTYA